MPPRNFWGILGNLTFLAIPHFERYARTEAAHFLQHFRTPPGSPIFPNIWPTPILDYQPKGPIFGDMRVGRDFSKIFENDWGVDISDDVDEDAFRKLPAN